MEDEEMDSWDHMKGISYKKKNPAKQFEFPGKIWTLREMSRDKIVVIF